MGRLSARRARILIAFFGAMLLAAVAAPAASAITVSNVQANPANTNAGANSDLALSFDLSGTSSVRDLVIHLPPGLVGNPLATPTCTQARLNADDCPGASKVGTVSNSAVLGGLVPITASGNVYNVNPREGEPARFGFVLKSPGNLTEPIILQSPARLRSTDFGLDTILNNVPNSVGGVPIRITGVDLNLNGKVGSPPKGFLRNPTSCGTNTVTVDATAYDSSTGSASDTFPTVNCGALPFSPEFSASIKQPPGATTDGVEVSTTISQTLEEAGLKRAVVTLPKELTADGAVIANTCSVADFDVGTCPESTVIGSAVAASPLQAQALTGNVYLVPSTTGNFLPDLGLDLRGALALKLKGTLGALFNPAAIQAQATFDNLPDIPISEFTLTFFGGPNGLNDAAPNLCAISPPPTFSTNFLAHSGQTVDVATPAKVDCSKGGGKGKKPKATVKLKVPKDGEPTMKLKLKAGAERIRSAKLKLPKGVSFDRGKDFDSGAEVTGDGKTLKGKAVKASRRSLKLKLKKKGAARIKGKFTGGAVDVKGKVKGSFKVVLRDVEGERSKLSVRP